MLKFIDKYWGAWSALGLLVLITICASASGVNGDLDAGRNFHGYFDKSAYLIGQGNVWAMASVGLSAALVVLTVQGWVRGALKGGAANVAFWPLLALLGKVAACAVLAVLVMVWFGAWLMKRGRARQNDATGAVLRYQVRC